MKLWYNSPAKEWTEALPLGNGHMGAMAYGGERGRFDLSENTCWSGMPQKKYLADNARDYMKRARKELINGNIEKGEELLCRCNGIQENYGTQLPLARLWVGVDGKPGWSRRSLDLRTGVIRDDLTFDSSKICRQSFISNPDKVMAVRLSAEGRVLPNVVIRLEGLGSPESSGYESRGIVVKGRALESMHSDGRHGTAYVCRLALTTDGDAVCHDGETLIVRNASEITVLVTAATDMFFDDPGKICRKRLGSAKRKGWDALLDVHIREHSQWMDRCSLELPDGEAAALPTDERLESYRKGKPDAGLACLYFQYGRYLLLNSSRPDSLLPAALQGVWNDDRACRMGWTDDMHLDINTQLNYFPAESTGLGECCAPLFRWITDMLAPNGRKIAEELYGCTGWVAHTVSNAYGWAAPGWGGAGWAFHVSGGAWVSSHLWIHYLYTEDKRFLKNFYPVLRGAAEFLYNLLLPDPKTGNLLVTPSYSPENAFLINGRSHTVSSGATVDTLIARYMFDAVCRAADILGVTDGLTEKMRTASGKMPGFRIGKYGQLMEWYEDYAEAYPDHRHMSHLLSLYPFALIDPDKTPELAEAARITLKRRLDAGARDIVNANWSAALLILFYSRLREGEQARKWIDHLIDDLSRENLMITHRDGIYELDGNTGFTAGISDMLMHSCRGRIHVLPAIPSEWNRGNFDGLIAEGGHVVSAAWEHAVPTEIIVTAGADGDIVLRFGDAVITCSYTKGQTRRFTCREGQLRVY